MTPKTLIAAAVVLFLVAPPTCSHAMETPYDACFDYAAQEQGVSIDLLKHIANVESGLNPNAVNCNKNGTCDYGTMQINSSWAKKLGKSLWGNIMDPCTNIRVGAWVLRGCIASYGYSWKAVGCYNSRTPGKNEKYAWKVYNSLLKAQAKQQAKPAPQQVAQAEQAKQNTEEDWVGGMLRLSTEE